MGRTPKVQPASELDRAIEAIEAKLDALQMALAALLDVKDPHRQPGRPTLVKPEAPQTADDPAAKPPRSHRRKTADAPKPEQDEKLDL